MAKVKFLTRGAEQKQEIPFTTSEEAWMWYAVSQVARDEGARSLSGFKDTPPPCTPDDIYRIVKALFRARDLSVRHVRVLFDYGLRLLVPHPKVPGEAAAARLWDEALDRLTTPFRQKGIVA